MHGKQSSALTQVLLILGFSFRHAARYSCHTKHYYLCSKHQYMVETCHHDRNGFMGSWPLRHWPLEAAVLQHIFPFAATLDVVRGGIGLQESINLLDLAGIAPHWIGSYWTWIYSKLGPIYVLDTWILIRWIMGYPMDNSSKSSFHKGWVFRISNSCSHHKIFKKSTKFYQRRFGVQRSYFVQIGGPMRTSASQGLLQKDFCKSSVFEISNSRSHGKSFTKSNENLLEMI